MGTKSLTALESTEGQYTKYICHALQQGGLQNSFTLQPSSRYVPENNRIPRMRTRTQEQRCHALDIINLTRRQHKCTIRTPST